MKPNSIFSFISRYWPLGAVFAIALVPTIPEFETPFHEMGAIIYAPSLVTGTLLVALLLRHLFFPNTLDLDAHSGWFVAKWEMLPDGDRVKWNLVVCIALYLGAAIIFAALAK